MIRTCLTIAALGFAAPALASEPVLSAPPAVSAEAPDAASVSPAEPVAMSLDDLDQVAGQGVEVNVLTEQDLTAVNSGNTVTAGSIQNGNISFSQGALSGFNGVGNFVSNTGNNNNLQGSISVTVINTSDLP